MIRELRSCLDNFTDYGSHQNYPMHATQTSFDVYRKARDSTAHKSTSSQTQPHVDPLVCAPQWNWSATKVFLIVYITGPVDMLTARFRHSHQIYTNRSHHDSSGGCFWLNARGLVLAWLTSCGRTPQANIRKCPIWPHSTRQELYLISKLCCGSFEELFPVWRISLYYYKLQPNKVYSNQFLQQ